MDTATYPGERLLVEELERRYRKARDPVLRSHYLIVWQMACGKSKREVAEATGYSERWVREVARRYGECGAGSLGDHQHENPATWQGLCSRPRLATTIGPGIPTPTILAWSWASQMSTAVEGRLGTRYRPHERQSAVQQRARVTKPRHLRSS